MSFEFGVLNFGVLLIAAAQFHDGNGFDDALLLGAFACLLWGTIDGLHHIGAFNWLITFLGFPAYS